MTQDTILLILGSTVTLIAVVCVAAVICEVIGEWRRNGGPPPGGYWGGL